MWPAPESSPVSELVLPASTFWLALGTCLLSATAPSEQSPCSSPADWSWQPHHPLTLQTFPVVPSKLVGEGKHPSSHKK